MAGYKSITLTKRDLPTPVLQLVHGDRETSGLRLNINRFDGGIDLGTLGWSINVVNAAGDSDIIMFTPEVTDMWVIFDWDVPAICAAVTGESTFNVEAVNANSEKVWQSGTRAIQVEEGLAATPGYDPEELSIFQKTISDATVKVKSLEDKLPDLDEAKDKAEEAAKAANDTAAEIRRAKEAGEFDGAPGEPGKDGKTPVKGVDYFDGAPGYTPVKGVDYFDGDPGYTPVKGVDYFDGAPGEPGKDYVLTGEDRDEISELAADRAKEFVKVDQPMTADTLVKFTTTGKKTKLVEESDILPIQEDVTELSLTLTNLDGRKIDKPDNPVVGKILKIKAVNEDGSIVCEWADDAAGQATDVQINGTSITENGVANIPIATSSKTGVAMFAPGQGLQVDSAGLVKGINNSLAGYNNAGATYVMSKGTLESAKSDIVRRALTTTNQTAYTDTEQAAACSTIGAVKERKSELIAEYTTDGTEHTVQFTASTSGRPLKLLYALVYVDFSESTGGTQAGDAYMKVYSDSAQIINCYQAFSTTSARKYEIFEMFSRFGYWMLDSGYTSNMLYGFTPIQLYRCDRPTNGQIRYTTDAYPYITKIERALGGTIDKVFPVGAKIRLEGVWAD